MSDVLAIILYLMGLGPNPDAPPEPEPVVLYGGGIPTQPPTPSQ